MTQNIILMTDSYKFSHFNQYPKDAIKTFSYFASRGGEYTKTYFFGLQYYIKKYLLKRITQEDIQEAQSLSKAHQVPFNKDGWEYIVNHLDGKLPIKIRAAKEGMLIPVNNALFTIENTNPKCFWLTSYVETLLLKVWAPITCATKVYNMKKIIEHYYKQTSDTTDPINFALHNFGDRGSTSPESAGINGMAHLTQFLGTDNTECLKYAKEFYGSNMAGFSIPASEHSTITSWGQIGEKDFVESYLETYKEYPIIACVADSYNIYNFVDFISKGQIKEKIQSDDYPILVIRPDSGEYLEVLGKILDILEENKISFETNNKGYKVFKKYRIIWGDGVDTASIRAMLRFLKERKYSALNINFGSGADIMQKFTRDTLKMAFKCSSITLKDGTKRDIFKNPITDITKTSKQGELELIYTKNKKIQTKKRENIKDSDTLLFDDVYLNGDLLREQSLDDIRNVHKKFML